MAAFSYRALNASGKIVKGTLEGDSERQVRGKLRGQGLKPINVEGVKQRQEKLSKKQFKLFAPRLKTKDLTLLTRQLASLIQSGMPLVDVLQGVAQQSRKDSIQGLILQVRSRVLEGLSLAQALAEYPGSFDSMYRAMIHAGEQAGFLGPVLERLADYTENSQHAKQKLVSAMIYPAILMLVCVAIVIALITLVVPQLMSIFERSKTELPWATEALIAMSDFLRDYGLFFLAALILLGFGFRYWVSTPENRHKWHRIWLKLPIFGYLTSQAETARFAGTLSLLLDSGVPLVQGVKIGSQTMENDVLRQAAKEVASTVKEGASLNKALSNQDVFPPLLVQMAASGEMNGTLAEQLQHAARNQERELDLQIGTVLNMLEPLMIVFMAAVVGGIMYAILTPIFAMSDLL